jgi:hypothetical protein
MHVTAACISLVSVPALGQNALTKWKNKLINSQQIHNVDEKKNCRGLCQLLNFSGKNDVLPFSTFSNCRNLDFILPNSGKSTCQKQLSS